MSMTSIAGTRGPLFVLVSQKTTLLQNSISSLVAHTFRPRFCVHYPNELQNTGHYKPTLTVVLVECSYWDAVYSTEPV